ncbi:hypothetical protein [Phormidium tenue]|jgi:hypothetical protein|uniref:Uncharacterized protein n=1 Tax=Phormidium tenue FACHB-1050 TaxID=2692857 RepID=A0ABR8CFJ5_9CYAN|nr:hypothetical protein [Phormidium tenue]MBD2318832.1 hypothetical protein [Phormidium tenue FACHB-1050]
MGIFRAIQRLISRITGNQKLRVQRAKATISLMSEREFEDLVSWLLGLQEKHIYEYEKQLLDTINQSNRAIELINEIKKIRLESNRNSYIMTNKKNILRKEIECQDFLIELYDKILNYNDDPNMNEEHSSMFLDFINVKSNEKSLEAIAMSLSIEEREKWLRMADTDWGRLQIFQKIGMEISASLAKFEELDTEEKALDAKLQAHKQRLKAMGDPFADLL